MGFCDWDFFFFFFPFFIFLFFLNCVILFPFSFFCLSSFYLLYLLTYYHTEASPFFSLIFMYLLLFKTSPFMSGFFFIFSSEFWCFSFPCQRFRLSGLFVPAMYST